MPKKHIWRWHFEKREVGSWNRPWPTNGSKQAIEWFSIESQIHSAKCLRHQHEIEAWLHIITQSWGTNTLRRRNYYSIHILTVRWLDCHHLPSTKTKLLHCVNNKLHIIRWVEGQKWSIRYIQLRRKIVILGLVSMRIILKLRQRVLLANIHW